MNSTGISIFVNILIFSIISVQLTSSASFPNPPQKPPSDASPDEQALFWKLLHNYYAIIARPRFGKRSDSSAIYSKYPSFLEIVKHNSIPSFSSEYDMNENIPNANRFNVDNYYTFEYPDRRRRR